MSHPENDRDVTVYLILEEDACRACDLFIFPNKLLIKSWIYAQRMCFATFILGRACLRHGRSRGETKYRFVVHIQLCP